MTADPSTSWPWQQLEGEPGREFGRFLTYLHLGAGRTFAAAAKVCSCSEALIRKNAAAWQWRERAAAYDRSALADLNERLRVAVGEEQEEALIVFRRQQALQAEALFTSAGLLLQLCERSTRKLLEADQAVPPATISGLASTAARLLETASENMARILGLDEAMAILAEDTEEGSPLRRNPEPMPGASGAGVEALERAARG